MGQKFEEAMRLLDSGTRNIVQSSYDDFCKQNTEFRAKAGLEVVIIREAMGECCSWCSDLEGVYTYDTAPDDVYARHRECNCVVSTRTKKGTFQDAWSKKEYNTYRENRIARAEEIEKEQEKYISPNIKEANAKLRLGASTGNGSGETVRRELGKIEREDAQTAVSYFKEQIRNREVENAIVIDKNGNVIHFVGDNSGVKLFDVDLEGANILHNHPESNGIVSFGEDDFYLIRDHQNAIYDLVNSEYDYHLEVIKQIDNLSYNSLKDFVTEDIQTVENLQEDYQHILMKGLKDKGYIKYERIKRR